MKTQAFFQVGAELIPLLFFALVFERRFFERADNRSHPLRLALELVTLVLFVVGEAVALLALLGHAHGRAGTITVALAIAFGMAVLVVPLVLRPAQVLPIP